jgi:hypothetical protein
MKKQSGSLRKLLSFSRWKRRLGFKNFSRDLASINYDILKENIIINGHAEIMRGSHNNLMNQMDALRKEFSGFSELHHYHASLIVLVRREAEIEKNIDLFFHLWREESDWLLKNLNIRWLVSAADTFADHASDGKTASLALCVPVLVNVIKAYESERYLCGADNLNPVYLADRVEFVQSNLVHLFQGLSCYTVGTDDTLRNMIWRIQKIGSNCIPARILLEVINRLSVLDTPFGRMRSMHTRKKTEWWF